MRQEHFCCLKGCNSYKYTPEDNRGEAMDTTFWLGLSIGAMLSLLASVMANLYTERMRQYFTLRRRIRLDSQKARELKIYDFVKKIRAGEITSMLEFNRSRDLSLYILMLCTVCLVLFVVFADNNINKTGTLNAVLPITLLAMALVCLCGFLAISESISRRIKKARDFEQYEANIRTKWGDDAI
jgi:hypothetical protein